MGLFDLLRSKAPRCPRDQTQLGRLARSDHHIDQCPRCHGIWIHAKEMRRLAEPAALANADRWADAYPQASGFGCPSCGGQCVGTFLDEFNVHTCVGCHGVWIDHAVVAGARQGVSVMTGGAHNKPELRAFLARL